VRVIRVCLAAIREERVRIGRRTEAPLQPIAGDLRQALTVDPGIRREESATGYLSGCGPGDGEDEGHGDGKG
jgi:hypothetical protein